MITNYVIDNAVERHNNALFLLSILNNNDCGLNDVERCKTRMYCYATMIANYAIIINQICRRYNYGMA